MFLELRLQLSHVKRKITNSCTPQETQAERDPENNKFYSAIEAKKTSLPGLLDIFANPVGIAEGIKRFASGQGRTESIKKTLALTLVSLGLSPAIAVLSTAEAPLEYLFGADPKQTTAEEDIHPNAGTGGLPKYFFGLIGYCFAVKAKLVKAEEDIAKAIAKETFLLEDFNTLITNGTLNNTTALMKFKSAGADSFENSLSLLINKLSEQERASALKTFCEQTGVTFGDLKVTQADVVSQGFTKSPQDVINVLQRKYDTLEQKYRGYFPEAQSKIVLATTGATSWISGGYNPYSRLATDTRPAESNQPVDCKQLGDELKTQNR